MFRIHDNVPEIYVQESRDFLILCRIYDAMFSGIKFDVDKIVDLIDAMSTRDTMLELMSTKLGFFHDIDIDAQVLKYIVASFPYIIKNKGSLKGIEYAVNAILKAETLHRSEDSVQPEIVIDNTTYTITIYTPQAVYNKGAFDALLKYVVPAGYTYSNIAYTSLTEVGEQYETTDNLIIRYARPSNMSLIAQRLSVSQEEDKETIR